MRGAMLIPSERHTPADRELWTALEAADLSHYPLLMQSGKIERSLDALRTFRPPFYASFSGGKDSLVMLDLLRLAGILTQTPVVFFHAMPKANPDAVTAVARAAAHFGIEIEIRPYESPVPAGPREEAEQVASASFLRECRQADQQFGNRVLGLRADESGVRKIRFRRWGLISKTCCAPLGWWSLEDVYSYAAANRLPLCPVYGMLGGGRWERHTLRVDALMGEPGSQFGRAEWEQEYYGDVLRRLERASRYSPASRVSG